MSNDAPNPLVEILDAYRIWCRDVRANGLCEPSLLDVLDGISDQFDAALRVAQPESGEIPRSVATEMLEALRRVVVLNANWGDNTPPEVGVMALVNGAIAKAEVALRGAISPSEPTEEVIQRAVDAAWRALWQDGEPQCAAPTEQDNEPFWRQIRAAVYAAQFGGAPPPDVDNPQGYCPDEFTL